MDGTNHSSQTLQSLSPDKREDLEHELRPEALASIAREENAEASTNTTHAAVSPKTTRASETETRAETASTGLVPPHETSTHTDRAVRTEPSVDDKSSLAIDFEGEGGFLEAPKRARPTKAPPKDQDRVRRFYGQFPTSRCVEARPSTSSGVGRCGTRRNCNSPSFTTASARRGPRKAAEPRKTGLICREKASRTS